MTLRKSQPEHRKIKTVWYKQHKSWCKTDSKIEIAEINPFIYGQKIFDNGTKTIQWGKDNLFNKWCWETRNSHVKE